MKITRFPIEDLKLIGIDQFADARGSLTERFHENNYEAWGLPKFLQDNTIRSLPGVLRGLHLQKTPDQGRLVTCVTGKVFDVVVDLRKSSATLGKAQTLVLDSENPHWLWVPPGFAHGFLNLGNEPADIWYKLSGPRNPSAEVTLHWKDPKLAIAWPVTPQTISEKDQAGKSLDDVIQSL